VLDVGCGDGELLKLLESRGVDGRGIELSARRQRLRRQGARAVIRATPMPTSPIIPTTPSTT
jgi:cyclopropane fatty-acyl-phospholipid synthase-like methyltransferase